jgi:methylmalonyl-CoA mutase cobalamin-binding subunit/DNA-binding transcriptional MerR regulator
VKPRRTPGKRRLYTLQDIERLNLLREVSRGGHLIGQAAGMEMEQLRALAAGMVELDSGSGEQPGIEPGPQLVAEAMGAIRALDDRALAAVLGRGATGMGHLALIQRVIGPLAQRLGEGWRAGELTAAQEHFATAEIRVFLANCAKAYGASDDSPVLAVATPAGQLHELGALLAAATAAQLGWRVVYLGASLPAAELAGAASQCGARGMALSIVYPEDDPRLAGELERLRQCLPADVALLAGGRAAPAYREVLERIGAWTVNDLDQLGAVLDGLRSPWRMGQCADGVREVLPPLNTTAKTRIQ